MNRRKNKNTNIYAFLLGMLTVAAIFVFAHPVFADVPLEVPIGSKFRVNDLPEYISLMYNFALSVIGIVATVMMMWGGFKWIAAAGNSSKIGDAKDSIYSALIGLILALLSFTLLFVINQRLVANPDPTIRAVDITGFEDLIDMPKCTDVAPESDDCYKKACGAAVCNFNNNGKEERCRHSYCGTSDDPQYGGLTQTCEEIQRGSGKFECVSARGISDACGESEREGVQCSNGKVCLRGVCTKCVTSSSCSATVPCCGYFGQTCQNGTCQKTLNGSGKACTDGSTCISGICKTGKCTLLSIGESCNKSEECGEPVGQKIACVNNECCILNGNPAVYHDPNSNTDVINKAVCCTQNIDANGKCANK